MRSPKDDLSEKLIQCPECGKWEHTFPAEQVFNQSLRVCGGCGFDFFIDWETTPMIEPEETDASGRTAEEFLSGLFEFELCPECGKDKEDHTAVIGPFGLWFAYCNKEAA